MILFYCTNAQQNLVPNGSFEDTVKCPININYIENAVFWINPTCLTPDLFHECNNNGNGYVGVPANYFGFQYARTGVAYAGIGTFYKNGSESSREYIQTHLLDTLTKGKRYCVSFYASLADSMDYATNKLGAYFSDTIISSPANEFNYCLPFTFMPQVLNTYQSLTNKTEWIEINGSFIANGGELYVTIGNFFSNANADTIYVGNGFFSPFKAAHYYIDDVSVYLCEDTLPTAEPSDTNYLHIPNIFTPNTDGLNDVWQVKARGVQQLSAAVYNRWGSLLWQQEVFADSIQNELHLSWDGRSNTGLPASAGTYYYLVTYTTTTGEIKKEKGFLTLIR